MKRVISLLLVIITMVSMLSCLAGCGKAAEYVTRGEWIMALGDCFGMDNSVSDSDYFTDVRSESPYYPYVQSCGDWGVLSNEESNEFSPDDDATVEFALETAIAAAEVELGDQSAVEYAISQGVIKDAGFMSVRGRLETETAQQILDWSQDLYLNAPARNAEVIVEYNENMKDMTDEEFVSVGEDVFTVSEEVADALSEGDVVMISGNTTGSGGSNSGGDTGDAAVKIEDIQENEDGTVTIITTDPEIEEVLVDFDTKGTQSLVWSKSDMILAEGVSFDGAGGLSVTDQNDGVYVSNLVNTVYADESGVEAYNLGIIPDITLNVNFTSGKLSLDPEWDSLMGLGESFSMSKEVPILPTKDAFGGKAYANQDAIDKYLAGEMSIDELREELDQKAIEKQKDPKRKDAKYTSGYEVTGKISISDIDVSVSGKYTLGSGLKASVATSYTVSSSLSVKGKLDVNKLLFEVPVPITTGITADVEFYLTLNASGELTVTAKISNNTKYSLENKVHKKTADKSASVNGKVAGKADFGPKAAVVLKAAGIPLVDVGIKAVARAKAEVGLKMETKSVAEEDSEGNKKLEVTRTTYWNVGVNVYVPIVSLDVNKGKDTIASKMKLSASWTLVGEDNAFCFEIIPEEEYIIWQEKLTFTEGAESTEPTGDATEETKETEILSGDGLELGYYFLSVEAGTQQTIPVIELPEGYSLSELVWSSTNSSVAAVSGGTIFAMGEGVATITVRTSDGSYFQQCVVSVYMSDDSEFIPIDENMGVFQT